MNDTPSTSENLTGRFRKRPVVIEAIQYRPDIPNCADVARFTGLIPPNEPWVCDDEPHADQPWLIATLEGTMEASCGDWIIRGVQGEHYPCKADIFAATYERADITGMLGARKPDLMVAEIERLRAAIAATWSTEMQSRLDAHCAYSDAYDQTLHNRPDPPDPGRGSD
jgi:hypothetical protein